MVSKRVWIVGTFLLALVAVSSVTALFIVDRQFFKGEKIQFQSQEGIDLLGTYYEGNVDFGIVFLPGFGSDQVMMRNMMAEFRGWNIHLFTFDYGGHGRSAGSLGMDNAQTDVVANQILTAKEEFKAVSGLSDDEILLMGHSMGARCAIQATIMDPTPVAGLILLGTQINLITNVQASFFTGVQDADLAWVQSMNANTPASDILLISGGWDDILTPTAADLLYNHLSATGPSNYSRQLEIIPALFHNYEVFSARAMDIAKPWAANKFGLENVSLQATTTRIRVTFWMLGIVGMLGSVLVGNKTLQYISNQSTPATFDNKGSELNPDLQKPPNIQLINPKKFIRAKLWLWLPSLLILVMIVGIMFLIPIPQPVFNIWYVGFIGSYGILQFLLYFRGKMLGIQGKMKLKSEGNQTSKDWMIGIGVALGSIATLALYSNTGLWFVFPLNLRLFWLVFFTLITSFGFYIGHKENEFVHIYPQPLPKAFNWRGFIDFVPFYLLLILYLILGSYSGMLGSIQGLLILAFVVISGKIVIHYTRNAIFTALYQAFLLQLIILPQGALFGF